MYHETDPFLFSVLINLTGTNFVEDESFRKIYSCIFISHTKNIALEPPLQASRAIFLKSEIYRTSIPCFLTLKVLRFIDSEILT